MIMDKTDFFLYLVENQFIVTEFCQMQEMWWAYEFPIE